RDKSLGAVDLDVHVVVVAEVLADGQPDGPLDGGESHLARDAAFALERVQSAEQLLPGLDLVVGAAGGGLAHAGLVGKRRHESSLGTTKKVGHVPPWLPPK